MNQRDTSLDIVKGIGIILMVIGHSGCPKWLHDVIYTFHMPLFFICSGYFYKPITTIEHLFSFWSKRIKGLYWPYIKWSVFFLLLHNLFYNLNIYSDSYGYLTYKSSLYDINEFVHRLKYIFIAMNNHEELLGGFWFLKTLLLSSIGFSVIDYLLCRWKKTAWKNLVVFLCLLVMTFITRYTECHFWIFGGLFQIFYGCLFFFTGYLYRFYSPIKFISGGYSNIVCLLMLCLTSIFMPNGFLGVHIDQILPYFIAASAGTLLTFHIARWLSVYRMSSIIVHIGKHTMLILALHFLAFKIVNLIKIYEYHLPPKMLSCFPIIEEHNQFFWLAYVIVGVGIPLLMGAMMNKFYESFNKKV